MAPFLPHLVSTDDELHGVAEKEEDDDEDEGQRRPRVSLLAHAQGLPETYIEKLRLRELPPVSVAFKTSHTAFEADCTGNSRTK